MLMRVSSRYFVAGLVFDGTDLCIRAAPILAWCHGKTRVDIAAYAKGKRWTVECLADGDPLMPGRLAAPDPCAQPSGGRSRLATPPI